MHREFMGDRMPLDIKDRTVIIVDDGIATGNTLLGAIRILKKSHPAKIILAVPVASAYALDKLSREVDKVVCPLIPDLFYGVGAFYDDFEQVTDQQVVYYIEKLKQDMSIH